MDEAPEKEITKLLPKQELFCKLYASDREFFGNGAQSYIEAYDVDLTVPKAYERACVSASQLLSNPKVIDRVNEILEETGMNDAFIDKQLSFLVAQHADFTNKLGAIKEYNKLKQRITEKSLHEIVLPKPIADVSQNPSVQENSEPLEEN